MKPAYYFGVGLFSGIINVILGSILLLGIVDEVLDRTEQAVFVFLFLLCVLSLVGACFVRRSGIFGGVLMILSGAMLTLFMIVATSIEPDVFVVLLLFMELAIVVAGILDVVSKNRSNSGVLGSPSPTEQQPTDRPPMM